MKQIFRFAAVAMLTAMSSSTALAGNWVVPAPAGQPLAVGDTVYIYNVGQKAWIKIGGILDTDVEGFIKVKEADEIEF